MSIETEVYAALKGLVPLSGGRGKVYPDLNDHKTAAPYIVFSRVGGIEPTYLENAVPSKENARVQVTCWDHDRVDANALAAQVLTALTALGWRPIGGLVANYDSVTKLRGASRDFSAWTDR